MSKDELNALQYIGGYIPHVLLKKYQRGLDRNLTHLLNVWGIWQPIVMMIMRTW